MSVFYDDSNDDSKLKQSQKDFLDGMAYIKDEIIDFSIDNFVEDTKMNISKTLDAILAEYANALKVSIKEYIDNQIDDVRLSMLDENVCEEYKDPRVIT